MSRGVTGSGVPGVPVTARPRPTLPLLHNRGCFSRSRDARLRSLAVTGPGGTGNVFIQPTGAVRSPIRVSVCPASPPYPSIQLLAKPLVPKPCTSRSRPLLIYSVNT